MSTTPAATAAASEGAATDESVVSKLAAQARVGDSVVLGEVDGEKFLEEIEDLISFVKTRAWPDLERDIRRGEKVLAEQVQDLTHERIPQKKMEESLAAKRESLAKLQDAYRVHVESLTVTGGAVYGSPYMYSDDGLKLKKWKYENEVKRNEMKVQIDSLKTEISQLEAKLQTNSSNFSKVPNESVYRDAFTTLEMGIKVYGDAVKKRAGQLMKARSDGPMLKMDPDVFERASKDLGAALGEVEAALMKLLTHAQASGAVEQGTIRVYESSMAVDLLNVENAASETRPGRLAVFERIRLDRQHAVNSAINEVEAVHRDILRKVTKPIGVLQSLERFDIVTIYALKVSRLGLLYAAAHMASRVFNNVYVDRMSTKDPEMPDLKWMVAAFFLTAMAFDLIVMGVAYFVAKILPSSVDMSVIKDFAVDTLAAHTMAAISLFSFADIIQDKRYFDFQVTAVRALRLMRQLCFWMSAFHAVVPYFYLTGPFYMQHKQNATETVL
eukprot:jgi/Tetstr1/454099/TSEL_041018.t1